ncbi:MAG: PIN domain-containing protein [Nitrospirota bacterium]
MAKVKLLIDTDIFIDALKEIKSAKDLFRIREIDIYCSILTKKELFSKEGLRDSERKKIIALLSRTKTLRIDNDILNKHLLLIKKYGDRPEAIVDYVIAATAWSKKLPLLTRNKKHFGYIKEITLSPVYEL